MQCRACVLGFAVAVSIACGVGTRQRVTLDPVAPAASKEWHAPSEQEAEAWGRRVETLARTGDIVRLAEAVDFGAILESASGGVDGVDDLREHFIRGVREKLSSWDGLFQAVHSKVARGGSYRFLRLQTVDGQRMALFRLLTEAGVNYHGFTLVRQADGEVRASNVYEAWKDEMLTRTLRRIFLVFAAEKNPSLLERLFPGEGVFTRHVNELADLARAAGQGRAVDALAIYRRLPEPVRRNRFVQDFRLMAAQELGGEELLAAVDDIERSHPEASVGDLVLVDVHFSKHEYDLAFECVSRIDRRLGGDPYLWTMQAVARTEAGRFADALQYVDAAIAAEPSLQLAHWARITILLRERRFAEVGPALDEVARRFELEIGDLGGLSDYSDYVRSPEYGRWLESRRPS